MQQANESLFKEKYISHGDIDKLLKSVKKETVKKYCQEFKKKSNASEININHRNELLLHKHPDFKRECTFFLQKKECRHAKCCGKVRKKEIGVGTVCLQVLGDLTIPFNTDHIVSQTIFFCANGHSRKTTSTYVHVSYPTTLFVSTRIGENDKEVFRRKYSIPL